MIRLDASTVLLQWSVGGLLFLWVTCRHRKVGIGYGWLLRSTYIIMLIGALVVGLLTKTVLEREIITIGIRKITSKKIKKAYLKIIIIFL